MEFLILSLIFSMVIRNAFALPSPSENRKKRDEFDLDESESYIQSLASLPLANNVPGELLNAAALPHEALHAFSSYVPPATEYGLPSVPVHTYGPPAPVPIPAPGVGVGITVDKHAILSPQIEVFRFLEAFIHFKTELFARLQHLINDNWDLVRSIINLVIGKIQKLQGFTLVFISILRQIFEYAVGLFSHFQLPSISVGVSGHVDPVPSFNIPSIVSAATGWLNG